MFYFYILQSETNGSYYKGSCEDVPERVKQHNLGKVKSTKSGIPWKLVRKESFNSRLEAIKREKRVKSWKKRAAIEKLIKHL